MIRLHYCSVINIGLSYENKNRNIYIIKTILKFKIAI